jgi:predicted DNA binding protein
MTRRIAELRTIFINGRMYQGGDLVWIDATTAAQLEAVGAIEPAADKEPAKEPQRAKK